MKNIASTQIANTRRLKKASCYSACLMVLLSTGWHGYQRVTNPEHPKGAIHSRAFIRDKALEIGFALNGSARLLTPPTLIEEHEGVTQTRYRKHKLWLALCESGDKQLNLLFDDKTGRLACMLLEIPGSSSLPRGHSHITTEAQAASVGLEGLKTLQVLPEGCEIALRERPGSQPRQDMWEINWLVRASPTTTPYTLKMALNRTTGMPTYMVEVHAKSG